MNLSNYIRRQLSNIPGWRSKEKLVVLESDDWGSIRMPSIEVYQSLKKKGVPVDGGSERYNLNDTLADTTDLQGLLEVLQSHKDSTGRPAVFTPICLVANPDFAKIKASDFTHYYFEPFTATLKRYGIQEAYKYWKIGIEQGIFQPEFHGREHLNVATWMRALQTGEKNVLLAFDYGCWGINNLNKPVEYQAAFDLEKEEDLIIQEQVIATGLSLFQDLFGYSATYFVPPNGPFNTELEKTTFENGILYLFSSKIHPEPLGHNNWKKKYRYLGKKNLFGQIYLNRNCFFEPSDPSKDWVDICLGEVNTAFSWRKPAVISTHRVNYIGGLNPMNRDKGLKSLDQLLKRILKTWPDVKFITSSELGGTILGSKV